MPVSLWQMTAGLTSLASGLVISMLLSKPGWAGLSTYTPLDEVHGWRIERKQEREGRLHCRASLPSGASLIRTVSWSSRRDLPLLVIRRRSML